MYSNLWLHTSFHNSKRYHGTYLLSLACKVCGSVGFFSVLPITMRLKLLIESIVEVGGRKSVILRQEASYKNKEPVNRDTTAFFIKCSCLILIYASTVTVLPVQKCL